jgi:DNA-binding MarR family transcriptional regulator
MGCARQLLAAVPLVMRFLRTQMRQHRHAGLTVPQFRALIFVNTVPAATLSELAEHVGLSVPAASRLVGVLVRRGLLTRRVRPENRRCVALGLTARGSAALERAYDCTRSAVTARLADLTARQLAQVEQAARVLQEVFQHPGDVARAPLKRAGGLA